MWKGRGVEGSGWSRVTVSYDRVRDVSHVEHGDSFVLWHRQPGKNTGVTAHLTCWDVAYTRRGPLVPTVEPVKRSMPETSCTATWESCTGSFVALIDFTNFSSFFSVVFSLFLFPLFSFQWYWFANIMSTSRDLRILSTWLWRGRSRSLQIKNISNLKLLQIPIILRYKDSKILRYPKLHKQFINVYVVITRCRQTHTRRTCNEVHPVDRLKGWRCGCALSFLISCDWMSCVGVCTDVPHRSR